VSVDFKVTEYRGGRYAGDLRGARASAGDIPPPVTIVVHPDAGYLEIQEDFSSVEDTPAASIVGTARGFEADNLTVCNNPTQQTGLPDFPIVTRSAKGPRGVTPTAHAAGPRDVSCTEGIGSPQLDTSTSPDSVYLAGVNMAPFAKCFGRLLAYRLRARLERKSCKVGLFCNWPLVDEDGALAHEPGVILYARPRGRCKRGKHRYRQKQRTEVTTVSGKKIRPKWSTAGPKPEYSC